MKQYHMSTIESNELPEKGSSSSKWEMVSFERRIDGITKKLGLHILRVESLIGSLKDRKTL